MQAVEPVRQSLLSWTISSLGIPYVILLPLAGLLCFLLTVIIVFRGKGPMAAAALVLIVPTPFLIGVFVALRGAIASFWVIAMSDTALKPAEVAAGMSTALVAPMVGMLLMMPSYAVAVVGALVRSLGIAEGREPGK